MLIKRKAWLKANFHRTTFCIRPQKALEQSFFESHAR